MLVKLFLYLMITDSGGVTVSQQVLRGTRSFWDEMRGGFRRYHLRGLWHLLHFEVMLCLHFMQVC